MTTTIVRGHKIRLVPTGRQERQFVQACGTARFAYNWGLAGWKRQHRAGMKPGARQLDKRLNAMKKECFPWLYGVSKWAAQMAIQNLGIAAVSETSFPGAGSTLASKGDYIE